MINKRCYTILICLFVTVTLAGCSGNKFDRQKWDYGDGLDYPLRNDILKDLLANHKLTGLNYRQLIDSLGSPQRREPLKFTYQILDDSYQFSRKKPAHKKNLLVYFSKDSVVVKTEVNEYDEKVKK